MLFKSPLHYHRLANRTDVLENRVKLLGIFEKVTFHKAAIMVLIVAKPDAAYLSAAEK